VGGVLHCRKKSNMYIPAPGAMPYSDILIDTLQAVNAIRDKK
jgi:hypothetical protein